jgi:hypothetical protein
LIFNVVLSYFRMHRVVISRMMYSCGTIGAVQSQGHGGVSGREIASVHVVVMLGI